MRTAQTAELLRFGDLRRGVQMTPIVVGLAAILAVVAAARLPTPSAYLAIVAWVALLAFAGYRWPGGTLVLAALASLADPVILPSIARSGSSLAVYGYTDSLLLGTGLGIAARAITSGWFVDGLRDRAIIPIAGYVLVALISAVVNLVPPIVTAAGIVSTIDAMAILFLARMAIRDETWLWRALALFLAIMGIAALVALGQRLLTPDFLGLSAFEGGFGEGARATAFFGNPNHLAPLLGMALAFAIFGFRAMHGRGLRIAVIVFIYVLMVALVLTFSRSGWLAFAMGTGSMALVFDRRALLITVGVGLLALATALYMPRELLTPQAEGANNAPLNLGEITIGRADAIATGQDLRTIFIAESIPVVLHDPIVGVGPGRFGGAAANVFGSPVYSEYGVSLYRFHTIHDYWLHQLAEVGVLGTLILAALMASLVLRLVQAARAAPDDLRRGLLLAIAAGTLAMSLNSLTEMLLEGNSPSFVLWLFIGLGLLIAERAVSIVATREPTAQTAEAAAT
jgi:putative inorganic carbon (HCO3(-)) transporter